MRRIFAVYILALLLCGCSISELPFVYHPDIQQGTVITQEMVKRLEPGMTREQVRFVLGSPLLDTPFHQDRWDYVYRLEPGDGGPLESYRLTVFFSDDRLAGARGDFVEPGDSLYFKGG